jgi:hypothetical protein
MPLIQFTRTDRDLSTETEFQSEFICHSFCYEHDSGYSRPITILINLNCLTVVTTSVVSFRALGD